MTEKAEKKRRSPLKEYFHTLFSGVLEAVRTVRAYPFPLKEYFNALFSALLLALVLRTFVVQAFTIPSGSMLQTVQIGDYLLVNKFAYGVKIPFTDTFLFRRDAPEIGDIIVFKYPRDPKVDYIKRVVGRPGDVVEMRNKQFYRNGEPVQKLVGSMDRETMDKCIAALLYEYPFPELEDE